MIPRIISLASGLFLMTLAFSAAAADLVVVASTAPDLKLGQIVDADAPLSIPAGASVTLVSESGRIARLEGPHDGPSGFVEVNSFRPSLVAALSGLLFDPPGEDTTTLAVMRSDSGSMPDDPWIVVTGRAGNQCVQERGPILLWRSKQVKATVLSLKNLDDSSVSDVDWPATTSTLAWPAKTTLSDGATYLMQLKGTLTARKIVLHVVPADFPSDAHKAVWMGRKGCVEQAKRLLASMQ